MYDSQSQKIIDYWTILEDKYENAFMLLYNREKYNNITISNNNEMKYLDVTIDQHKSQQYTHIHSFINEMIDSYGINVLENYVIKCLEDNNKKRCIDNKNNKINKRTKYE